MPLKRGSSKKIISENIAEIIRSYKKTGKIGSSKPKNTTQALKQAIAISEANARVTKRKYVKKK